jgi:NADH dehydrogenase/NADH:ubiquinone oxidoreductase subunit G
MFTTRDSIADIWGPRTPHAGPDWPIRVDQNVEEDPDRWIQASCFLCSNGCGIDIGVKDDQPGGRIVGVRGREMDVVNRGRLGPKGLYGWVANASPDRLTDPLIRRGDRLDRASWDEAMDLIVRRVKDTKENYTAGSIGFYSSGQLFAEENYTLSVIAKAGIRTLHIDKVGINICCSLGLMSEDKVRTLKEVGVERINHNLNTSREYHPAIVTTHTYEDRVTTVQNVKSAGVGTRQRRMGVRSSMIATIVLAALHEQAIAD